MTTEMQINKAPLDVPTWLARPDTLQQLRAALPSHFPAERMARLALTAFRTNKDLQRCNPSSIMASIMTASQLGLEPNVQGQCYLVPYGQECQLIIGYQGLLDLVRRSGQVKMIAARVVYAGDEFGISYETTPPFFHRPDLNRTKAAKIVGVYAHAILTSGEHVFEYMTTDDVEAVRQRGRAKGGGPWSTDWSEMARKTCLKRASKYLPKSVQMIDALELADKAEAPIYADTETPVATVKAAHSASVPLPPPPAPASIETPVVDATNDETLGLFNSQDDDSDGPL